MGISSFDYAVNVIGQRSGVATSGTAFPALPSWAWSYDAIGNREKSANSLVLPVANNYTANSTNAYMSVQLPVAATAITPAYDFDGNATSYPFPAGPSMNSTLVWDAENRLISITTAIGMTTNYRYDASSRRIAKISGTAATAAANLYLYDGWNCAPEYTKTAGATPVVALAKTQLWGMNLSGTMQGAGVVGGLLAVRSGTTTHYPTYDGNGNISEYLTATGTIAAHFEYDPFGNIIASTGSISQFAYRFSTKPIDLETRFYYYGYRYYDPLTGRWPSRDPIEERGGINLYGFLGNYEVNKWDVLGMMGRLKPNEKCSDSEVGTKNFNSADRILNSARPQPGLKVLTQYQQAICIGSVLSVNV